MKPIKHYIHSEDEQLFAKQLAHQLNDHHSLAFYLSCVRKYPHNYLIQIATHVLALPDHSIKTTRPRLFNSIVSNSNKDKNDVGY